MSNGTVCCLLGVCCPPDNPGGTSAPSPSNPKRVAALATEMSKWHEWESAKVTPTAIATSILAHFDLVPKGLGDAIVEAYRPEFAKLAASASTHP